MGLTRNDAGKLDAYAFPGGYAIRYLCKDGEVVCAKCANELDVPHQLWAAFTPDAEEPDDGPVDCFIDWEGPGCHCAHYNDFLPSEYGDPDANETTPKE